MSTPPGQRGGVSGSGKTRWRQLHTCWCVGWFGWGGTACRSRYVRGRARRRGQWPGARTRVAVLRAGTAGVGGFLGAAAATAAARVARGSNLLVCAVPTAVVQRAGALWGSWEASRLQRWLVALRQTDRGWPAAASRDAACSLATDSSLPGSSTVPVSVDREVGQKGVTPA